MNTRREVKKWLHVYHPSRVSVPPNNQIRDPYLKLQSDFFSPAFMSAEQESIVPEVFFLQISGFAWAKSYLGEISMGFLNRGFIRQNTRSNYDYMY